MPVPLQSRLRRLEDVLRVDVHDSPCGICGYPDSAVRVAFFHEDDAQVQCVTCQRELSGEGLPLHRDGIRAVYVRETCIAS